VTPVPREFRRSLSRDDVHSLWATGLVRLFHVGQRFRIVRAGLRSPDPSYERSFEDWWSALESYRVNSSSHHRHIRGNGELRDTDGRPDDEPHLHVVGDIRDPSYASIAWTEEGYRKYREVSGWARLVSRG